MAKQASASTTSLKDLPAAGNAQTAPQPSNYAQTTNAVKRSTYVEAVRPVEQGLERMPQHDYRGAAIGWIGRARAVFPRRERVHERAKARLNSLP